MKLLYLKLKDRFGWNCLFLFAVLIIYFLIGLFNFQYFLNVWYLVINIFIKQILFVLILVFIFMFILNILLQKNHIKDKLKKSKNSTKYFISIIGWIFSTGPVYMWYPLLKKLKNNGLSYGHIATFIYARAVKIPLLVVMVFYFGFKYTVIFNLVLICLASSIWMLIDLIFNKNNYEENNS